MITRVVFLWTLCCTLTASAAQLFPTNSTWRWLKGRSEASSPDITAWRAPGFADTAFTTAPAPFWFGDVRPGGTELTDMSNNYTCLFLRKIATVSDASLVGALRLTYFIDDGFVLWLNGVEVYRENVGDANPTIATLAANQAIDPAPLTTRDVVLPAGALVNGDNVFAVQVFNTSATSSDLGFDLAAETIVAETVPPTIATKVPGPGTVTALTQITVTFSEPVTGVDAGDLLLNGIPVDGVSGGGTTYTFNFPQPPYGEVFVRWSPGNGIADEATPPNPFNGAGAGATWQYTLIDQTPPSVTTIFPTPGSALRALSQVEITFSEEVIGVEAADLHINGVPATGVTRSPGGPYVFQFPSQPAGAVTMQWAAGAGITDQAVPANPFAGGTWSYTVDPNLAAANLVINEFLAANISGLQDEDGQEQDWIEIQNRGTTIVDLTGWSLTDDPELPGLWSFGSGSIGPGAYLIVFASGKDRRNPSGANRHHANFQLSAGGEFLGLYNPDSPRVLVSSFGPKYPEQRNDYSYGYDSQGNPRYFSTPTPGAANGSSGVTAVCAPVHFSMSRGFFTQPFDLALSTPTPAGYIRYTLDGTIPTDLNGRLYAAPLRVTNTTLLRAAAFRSGALPSTVATHTYFFNQSAAIRSLPVLSIVTASSNLVGRTGILGMNGGSRSGDGAFITNNAATDYHNPSMHGIAWERPVSAELIEPADNSGFQIDCGIRVQGSDWQRPRTTPTSKFSLRLYFRSDYGPGRLEYPLFPNTTVQSFDQLVLRAGYNEPANPFIRDELGRRLFGDMGNVSSQGRFFQVFTNGSYAGYYNPCERVHEEWAREHHGGSGDWDIIAPSFATSSEGLGVVDGDRNDFSSLHNYINGQTATTINNPAVYLEIARRLDLKNFVDYCLINTHAAMGDWPANNWRAGKDRGPGGIWRFYVWDAEWGFGFGGRGFTRDSFAESGGGPGDSGLNSTGASEIARIYQKLRSSREFRLLWADRIHKHYFNGGALTDLNITNRLSEMRTELGTVFAMNMGELSPFLSSRRGYMMGFFNFYGLYGVSNSLYGTYASSNAPVLSQHGGRVAPGFSLTMTAPLGGIIYYTTNGHDPRVPFSGAVSNAAVAYSGPVVLGQSLPIKARTLLDGTNWSALADAAFEVGTLGTPVRITEIMYNPQGGTPYEYIELQNIGGNPLDIGEFRFTDGISFTFLSGTVLDPGARIVLANNTDPNAFALAYPGVAVAGYFGGNLNNSGERVTLVDRNNNIVDSVDYRDTGGWPQGADGLGASLEIVDVYGNPDDPANWRARAEVQGSPGAPNPPVPSPGIEFSEVLAENRTAVNHSGTFPDFVELFNPSATAASLAGWSLTDDGNVRKFVLPAGTSIPALSRLVIWLDATTNTSPGLHAGFALSQSGASLFLYNTNSALIDALSLGLQLPDRSVSRVNGQWILSTPTPNAVNSATAVAAASALRLNEWLANPISGQPDWIELYNTAAQPVALRGLHLSNGSGTHRITSLSFIEANGFVQLFADEGAGPDHLEFRLPAAGAMISLYDAVAAVVDSVSYTNAVEGASRGRLPDGTATLSTFTDSVSPGAPNYVNTYSGPVLNEILARNHSVTNAGRVADFVELVNGGASAFDLGGFSLSVNRPQAGAWTFPPGTTLAGGAHLVLWCDDATPPAFTAPFNLGEALDGESGGVYLFNTAGQLVNSVEYGFQIPDRSIGRISGQWRLLAAPTPGAANTTAATLGAVTALRVNEWMADPASGPDWFELHNPSASPIELTGLVLTDDASLAGLVQFRVPALSFIGPGGFTKWIADGNTDEGRDHVSFSLDGAGESILLLSSNAQAYALIDGITFAPQASGVSEGRLPDGAAAFARFPGSPTPAEANYQLAPVFISEILTHAAAPLEDSVEIHNPGSAAVNIGGWYLSNRRDQPRKFRVPDGTTVAAGAYVVFTQSQFGNNGTNSFTFSSARGDEAWLSAVDAGGALTGVRAGAVFGPAANNVSFGRIVTSVGVDYAPLSARSPGGANAAPLLGPIVLSEIHYNPPGGGEEFIELHNLSGAPVPLFDPAHPANTWQLGGGVRFAFPAATVPAGGYALVVGFDPANSIAAGAFRARYGVAAAVPLFGPFTGRLANEGDRVELLRPDAPQGPGPDEGLVPMISVDRADYGDGPPWPAGMVDGGGFSLQRKQPAAYGNEPTHWFGASPTAGAPNGSGALLPPSIIGQPQSVTRISGQPVTFSVAVTGAPPVSYQWRFNGVNLPEATQPSFTLSYPYLENEGFYDAVVSNPAGSEVSAPARLTVLVQPEVLAAPASVATFAGSNVVLTVFARGSAPLRYQWSLNGVELPGRTNATLALTNVQLADDGQYDVLVSNSAGTTTASARLDILVRPAFTLHPASQPAVVGQAITLSVEATGNPLPFTYEWRRGSLGLRTNILNRRYDHFTVVITNRTGSSERYRAVIRNAANLAPGAPSNEAFITILPDTDNDGLPDAWETQYGSDPNVDDRNLDNDHDGQTNWQEYLAGTDPNNPASFVRVDLNAGPASAMATFNAISNRTYSVLYSDDLSSGQWFKLRDVLALSSNRVENIPDPAWQPQRYYKLVTPAQ